MRSRAFDQILVARHLPELAMEGQVVLIKLIEVECLRSLRHPCRDTAQVFDVCGRHVLLRPLDGQRFQLAAQAEDLLHVAPFEFGDGRALVGNLLDIPLMLELDQRLAHQRNAGPKLLSDLALDDRFAGLNDPAQDRLLERSSQPDPASRPAESALTPSHSSSILPLIYADLAPAGGFYAKDLKKTRS